jgi:hypothetical protein
MAALDPRNAEVFEAKAALSDTVINGRLQAIGDQVVRDMDRIVNLIGRDGISTGDGKKTTVGAAPALLEEVSALQKRIEWRLAAVEEKR